MLRTLYDDVFDEFVAAYMLLFKRNNEPGATPIRGFLSSEHAKRKANLKAMLKTKRKATLKAMLKAKLKAKPKAKLKANVKAMLKTKRKAKLKAMLKAKLKAKLKDDKRQC